MISKASSPKKGTNQIAWKKAAGAAGYEVYFSKKENGKYKKLKTLAGNKKRIFTHTKLKNGTAYYYKVYSYWKVKGKKTRGNEPEAYQKYCEYYTHANESWENKEKRIYGSKRQYKYTTSKQAGKRMTTIRVKVWDVNKKGKKFTRKQYLTVNKALAPSVKKMFKEIYKGKERFPIHELGC